jgi:hypothetical protein
MRSEPSCKGAEKPRKEARTAHSGKGKSAMQRLSKTLRANHPICQVCNVRPSTEVHHVVKWRESELHRLDPRFLLCVCRACHEQVERHGEGA